MTPLLEVFRFEVEYQLRRTSTRIYFAIFFVLALGVAKIFIGDAQQDGYLFNSPVITAIVIAISSIVALLLTAAVASDAATRDAYLRMEPLLFTSPVRKMSYLGGRFLGAFAVSALVLLAVPIGLMLVTHLAPLDPHIIGPFRPLAYVGAYALFALPNVFVTTALLFAAAALTRRAMTSYFAATLLFLVMMFSNELIARILGQWELARNLDLSGFTALHALWRSWTPLQKSTLFPTLQGAILTNRVLWLGFAGVLLTLTFWRFRLAAPVERRASARRGAGEAPAESLGGLKPTAPPAARRTFGLATRLRQTLAVAASSLREILTSPGALLLPIILVIQVVSGPELLEVELGIASVPATARVIRLFGDNTMAMIIAALITFYAGMLVWRERDARAHALADVTPVSNWVTFAGKYLGLATLLVALQSMFLAGGLLVQASNGYSDFELPLYLKVLGIYLTDYLLFAMLAMFIHVVVNQKYLAHTLAIVFFIFTANATDLGFEHALTIYGSDPGWQYSDLSGFGPHLGPWMWFKLFWTGWAMLFATLMIAWWSRGEARRRFTRVPAMAVAACVLFIASVGGFIFYNTNVLHHYRSSFEQDEVRANYERRYGKFEGAAQPEMTGTKLHVEMYPDQRKVDIRGTYRLVNRTAKPIDAIHLLTYPELETRTTFDRASSVTVMDAETGHRTYTLAQPLRSGETVQLNFEIHFAPQGFPHRFVNAAVTRDATYLEHMPYDSPAGRRWLPLVGYQPQHELSNDGTRREHGLVERPDEGLPTDVAARSNPHGRAKIDFEAVIGTNADQTAVAPGMLRRTWLANGRRYFHYATNAPIREGYAIFSAKYAVHDAQWKHVHIQVVHHPKHARNVGRMVRSVKASLDYYTREFGPYPYSDLRLVEYPGASGGLGMRAHPATVMFSEGFGLIDPIDDPRELDLPFAVVAHEMGHHWWGNQVVPARLEGAALVSESLAWYSGMMVVREAQGEEKLERLVAMMRREYLTPSASPEVPLLRARDHTAGYRNGPFAMYALRDAVGEKAINTALRRLLAKHGEVQPPYATSLDLYAELQAVTPAPARPLLADLFEHITFWDLSVKRVAARGSQVTMDVEAYKLRSEKRVPMDNMVEVGVFDADDKLLYRGKHRIRSGMQTITITVPRAPAYAAIDPRNYLLDRNLADNDKEF